MRCGRFEAGRGTAPGCPGGRGASRRRCRALDGMASVSLPRRGCNKSAQGRAERREPRCAALGERVFSIGCPERAKQRSKSLGTVFCCRASSVVYTQRRMVGRLPCELGIATVCGAGGLWGPWQVAGLPMKPRKNSGCSSYHHSPSTTPEHRTQNVPQRPSASWFRLGKRPANSVIHAIGHARRLRRPVRWAAENSLPALG